jgi:hypothetical protein
VPNVEVSVEFRKERGATGEKNGEEDKCRGSSREGGTRFKSRGGSCYIKKREEHITKGTEQGKVTHHEEHRTKKRQDITNGPLAPHI